MPSPKYIEPFHKDLAQALGSAGTMAQARSVWALLEGQKAIRPETLAAAITHGAQFPTSVLVEMLDEKGWLGNRPLALLLAKSAIAAGNNDLMGRVATNPNMGRLATDGKGQAASKEASEIMLSLLDARLHTDQRNSGLSIFLKHFPFHQDTRNLALQGILLHGKGQTNERQWAKSWNICIEHGADPFFCPQNWAFGGSGVGGAPLLFYLAKQLDGPAQSGPFLRAAVAGREKECCALAIVDSKGVRQTVASVWAQSYRDPNALIELLDVGGGAWWDGDPLGVFAPALKMEHTGIGPVLYHMSKRAREQGVKVGLDASHMEAAFTRLVNQRASRGLSETREFWEARKAGHLGSLWTDPAPWTALCQAAIAMEEAQLNSKRMSKKAVAQWISEMVLDHLTPKATSTAPRISRM